MALQDRVMGILTKPAAEWQKIAAESADTTSLFRDYVAPLAAIPAVCRFVGLTMVGMSLGLLGTYRIGIAQGLAGAIVSYVFSLLGVWIAAVVVQKLAPTFQSRESLIDATKLVAYSMTPVWVAGVLNLIPALATLVILAALYAIYLFYLGLPVLMGTPADKVVPYMIVSALVIIVVSAIFGVIAAAVTGLSGGFAI
jgi:Yip1 domain